MPQDWKRLTMNDLNVMPWQSRVKPEIIDDVLNYIGTQGYSGALNGERWEAPSAYGISKAGPTHEAVYNKFMQQLGPIQGPVTKQKAFDLRAGEALSDAAMWFPERLKAGAVGVLDSPSAGLRVLDDAPLPQATNAAPPAPSSSAPMRLRTGPEALLSGAVGDSVMQMDERPSNMPVAQSRPSLVNDFDLTIDTLDPEYMDFQRSQMGNRWSDFDAERTKALASLEDGYNKQVNRLRWLAGAIDPKNSRHMAALQTEQLLTQLSAQRLAQGQQYYGGLNDDFMAFDSGMYRTDAELAAAKLKARGGGGPNVTELSGMAEQALVANGVPAALAKASAPLLLKISSEGLSFSPEMFEQIVRGDKEAAARMATQFNDALSKTMAYQGPKDAQFDRYRNALLKRTHSTLAGLGENDIKQVMARRAAIDKPEAQRGGR